MKMICPQNPKHKRFVTTAHVMQEWEVDERGAFQEVLTECLEVTHKPSSGNIWICTECYSEAIIDEE